MTLIVKEIKTGLKFSDHYEIEVAATSMGIARSRRKSFSKIARSQLQHCITLCSLNVSLDTIFDAQIVCTIPIESDITTQQEAFNTTSACLQPGKFYFLMQ